MFAPLCRCLPALLVLSCAAETPIDPPHSPIGFDLTTANLVDLSHAFGPDTLYWPTSPSGFELDQLAHGETDGGWFYSANAFRSPEHGGTHLDAPIHFAEARWTTDEIPLDHLVGPAVVIDIREQSAIDRDYRATRADLEAWETQNGPIPDGSIVLLNSGWDRFWGDHEAVFGAAKSDDPNEPLDLHFPAWSESAARFLLEERSIVGLGVDTPSIDYGPSTDFPVHRLTAEANVYGLENVANLDELPAHGARLVALPMKIQDGSGGPVRVIAFVPH